MSFLASAYPIVIVVIVVIIFVTATPAAATSTVSIIVLFVVIVIAVVRVVAFVLFARRLFSGRLGHAGLFFGLLFRFDFLWLRNEHDRLTRWAADFLASRRVGNFQFLVAFGALD